jgi:hypothetical protein
MPVGVATDDRALAHASRPGSLGLLPGSSSKGFLFGAPTGTETYTSNLGSALCESGRTTAKTAGVPNPLAQA